MVKNASEKIELLNAMYEIFCTKNEIKGVCLIMSLPYRKTEVADLCEIILIPKEYLVEKANYIKFAYDDNLVMKNNEAVQIVGYFTFEDGIK